MRIHSILISKMKGIYQLLEREQVIEVVRNNQINGSGYSGHIPIELQSRIVVFYDLLLIFSTWFSFLDLELTRPETLKASIQWDRAKYFSILTAIVNNLHFDSNCLLISGVFKPQFSSGAGYSHCTRDY